MQESLGLGDRVRYAPQYATSPCMQLIGSAPSAKPPGCGRGFTSSTDMFAEGPPTPLMNYDSHFAFSFDRTYNTTLKQIPFTCASTATTALCARAASRINWLHSSA